MSQPIVFISRNKIKAGKAEEFRKHYQAGVPAIIAGKAGTLAQLAYENEDCSEIIIVRIFPNADALEQQIIGADERSRAVYQLIVPVSIEIFGAPNAATLEKMQQIVGPEVTMMISPDYIGGFIRK
ncbi:MAG: hypothetical protein ACK2UW_14195 [Anaerolineales bacterium]|jgi:hypothetical protein